MNTIELKRKLNSLQAEIESVKKQLALTESYFPETGSVVWFLFGNGSVKDFRWWGGETDIEMFEQGNVFLTERAAGLTRDYRQAVARINRAIRAGESGDLSPNYNASAREWYAKSFGSADFCTGSKSSIMTIVRTHSEDFNVVRQYIEEVLHGS
jgi:hypothetical protein